MMNQTVRLLAIDLRKAAPALGEAFRLTPQDLDDLLGRVRALEGKVDLVVVSDSMRLELYSTEPSHAKAFRAVLRELIARVGGRDALGELPTLEASGVVAAEHLMQRAVGMSGFSGLESLSALNLAVVRSRRAGTLGRESSVLFAGAVEAGWRAYCETAVSDPTRSQAERDVAVLEAERIAEEALVAWKALCQNAVNPRRRALRSGVFVTTKTNVRVA
jgi:glutamyl-tRNA reductase